MTDVISRQSQAVHGHVGSSPAVLPMPAEGLKVAAAPQRTAAASGEMRITGFPFFANVHAGAPS